MKRAQKKDFSPLRIFMCNWHTPAMAMLAKTGHLFDVPDWDHRLRGLGWRHGRCPKPENVSLISDQAVAVERLRSGAYDLMIAQTPLDVEFLAPYRIPAIYLSHNRLLSEVAGHPDLAAKQRAMVARFLSERNGLFCAVSKSKLISWGLDGRVLPVSVDTSEWGGYHGSEPCVLMVGNDMYRRDHMFNTRLRRRLVEGFPHQIIGLNPELPGSIYVESQAELLKLYQRCRVYLHVTNQDWEDGYNMALLEAMATGMPVVSWGNLTSPLINGYNGFVAEDEDYLRRCLKRLFDNPDLAMRFGRRARQTVEERFDLHHLVRAFGVLRQFQANNLPSLRQLIVPTLERGNDTW